MNHFLEEIIRNKFKRTQIFENVQLEITRDKYMYDNKNEILIKDEDIIGNVVNEMYQTIKNNFYKNIDIFDYNYKGLKFSSLDRKTKDLFQRKSCLSKTSNKNITYQIHKNRKLNNNPDLSYSFNVQLSNEEYNKIKSYLDFENANLTQCPVSNTISNIAFIIKD